MVARITNTECGGKNFHFIHPSAELATVAPATIRSAFEYQGQKCSACSRAYVPQSLWPQLQQQMLDILKQIKVGPVRSLSALTARVNAVKTVPAIAGA